MLINALCSYYDILAESGKVLPDGYSRVKIHYIISVTEDGRIDDVIDCQKTEEILAGKNKVKEKKVPLDFIMPQRTEKTGIEANFVEHRPVYIFGLNLEKGKLTSQDDKHKAEKSHRDFVKTNLELIEGLNSPLIMAYKNFMIKWNPAMETENQWLLKLGNNYGKSGFAFCLSGNPDQLLHDDPVLKRKWEYIYTLRSRNQENILAQCAVTGQMASIARLHSKIKGVYGGLATGSVLIGFNNESENSYGHERAYNSNISELVMKKYTEALNFLLSSDKHKVLLDDMTIVFWAMNEKENCEDLFMRMLSGQQEEMNADQTEQMLRAMLQDARDARITEMRLLTDASIDPDVDFYMLGLKPNASRLSVKFIIRKKYADVFWNIADFQKNIQIGDESKWISFSRIKKILVSPKSKNEKVNPALISKLFESIIYGGIYPISLLETVIRRVKIDSTDGKVNSVQAGIIKGCLNKIERKEDLKVSLDVTNTNQAYLCGRLFAVLEKLQQDASRNTLNRTIKDAYFASASAKPAIVFPKLIRLAQNHLNKVKYPIYYNKMMGEIIEQLSGEFPETLMLKEQGKFIIGYYQQYQSFFRKTEKSGEEEEV